MWFPKGSLWFPLWLPTLVPLGFHIKAATAERPEPPDAEHAGRVPVRAAWRGMGKRGGSVGDRFFYAVVQETRNKLGVVQKR